MFGLFKKAKPHTLTIEGVGTFEVQPSETILNAALRHGVRFPHSCKVGGCATCKCKKTEGTVKELTSAAFILEKADLDNGYILGCQSQLKSDVTISVDALSGDRPAEEIAATIVEKEALTHDITRLTLELEKDTDYLPGQYAMFSTPAVTSGSRCYSYAAPAAGNKVTFFIREVPGGEMSGWVKNAAQVGDRVSIDGPHGDFHLRSGQGDMLFIAGGSGLAPVLAILEDAVRHKLSRDVTFLFGARTQADLYGLKQIEHIRQNWSGTFQFVPVLSQEPEGSDWEGARGLVTEHIPQNPEAIEQVYMCGPPPMLDAASAHLQNAGLADSQIFADRFTDRSINTNTSNNKPANEPELAAG